MWEDIAAFLLEIPPIQEIGGKITHVIEQYRAGILKRERAICVIIQDHQKFLETYAELNESIDW